MRKLAFFDLETTGADPWHDRIVEVAVVTSDGVSFTSLVNPDIPIPEEASAIHGITDERVASAEPWTVVGHTVADMMRDAVLVGYNIHSFDTVVLSQECSRCGIEHGFMEAPEIDLYRIWKRREGRTLAGAIKRFLGEEHEEAHQAMADVQRLPYLMRAMSLELFGDGEGGVEHLLAESVDPSEIDREGKFVRDEKGVIRYNFGKHKGVAVNSQPSYLDWMLSADFSVEVKRLARSLKERSQRSRVAAQNRRR